MGTFSLGLFRLLLSPLTLLRRSVAARIPRTTTVPTHDQRRVTMGRGRGVASAR